MPAPSRRRARLVPALLGLPLLLFLALPVAALLLRAAMLAGEGGVSDEDRAVAARAIALSVGTATTAAALAVALGTPLAYAVARGRFRGRAVVDTLVDLPLVLPPAVAGVALLVAFGRRGLFGGALASIGVELPFTTAAVVVAQLFVAAPYYVKAAAGGFARVDRDLEEAAALDGAGPWRVFRNVTVPLCWPAMVGGAAMAWARALGEFGATIIFAGNFPGRTQTMPIAIYLGFEVDIGLALELSVLMLAVSGAALAAVRWALGRDLDAYRDL